MRKIALVLVFAAAVAVSGSAQTPAKKDSSMAAGPTLSGSEQWMDIPAAAMVGTPSVPAGGTLKDAILQGDPMTPSRSYVARISCTDGSNDAPAATRE